MSCQRKKGIEPTERECMFELFKQLQIEFFDYELTDEEQGISLFRYGGSRSKSSYIAWVAEGEEGKFEAKRVRYLPEEFQTLREALAYVRGESVGRTSYSAVKTMFKTLLADFPDYDFYECKLGVGIRKKGDQSKESYVRYDPYDIHVFYAQRDKETGLQSFWNIESALNYLKE